MPGSGSCDFSYVTIMGVLSQNRNPEREEKYYPLLARKANLGREREVSNPERESVQPLP